MKLFNPDAAAEKLLRRFAGGTSRRGMLARIGGALVAAPVFPGALCSCCGGGIHTCPPGAESSPVSWVGTCINPEDGKAYMIAYRDCCGKPMCTQCMCDNQDREMPLYVPQLNNNIIWCFGTQSMEYHCSTAVMVGPA